MKNPSFTFVSVSTAKPGRLDDLVRVASRPNELMDDKVDGVIARQVAVDRERNAVVVWTTLERKEPLYEYLSSPEGQADHTGSEDLSEIVETFEMYEMTPVNGRLA